MSFFVTSPSHLNTSTATLPAGERSPGSIHRKLSKPAQCSLIFIYSMNSYKKSELFQFYFSTTAEKWSDNGCFFNYTYICAPCVVFFANEQISASTFLLYEWFEICFETCNYYSSFILLNYFSNGTVFHFSQIQTSKWTLRKEIITILYFYNYGCQCWINKTL